MPGRILFIDDDPAGREVALFNLRKAGYEQLDDRVMIRTPFYLWIPFDLMAELVPLTIRDEKTLSYTLRRQVPLPEPAPPAVEPTTEATP